MSAFIVVIYIFFFLQLNLSSGRLPEIQALVKNLTARLEPYQYLHNMGLYTDLSLRQLAQKIGELEVDVSSVHRQQGSRQTGKLVDEVRSSVTHFTQSHNVIRSLSSLTGQMN